MKILDCTLRDGGYYNRWDFTPELVDAYLTAVSKSKIDIVELGLRNYPQEVYSGPFAYTTEEFLSTLVLPEGPIYGVMVDAKTVLGSGKSVEQSLSDLFVPASQSKIKLVRVAAHFSEVEQCPDIIKILKNMGYMVGLNLMQAGGKSDSEIRDKVAVVAQSTPDVIYFADSLGNMLGEEVTRITKLIGEKWAGDIGIHTHNNMGQGISNTLVAKDNGVNWLDVTVTGMGRGAGNSQTENLLAELEGKSKYCPSPIYELVVRYFEQMQKDYGWGSSLLYYLGAKSDIHPTYIQNMLSNPSYGKDEIVGAIENLRKLEHTQSYDSEILEKALSIGKPKDIYISTSDLSDYFCDREVMLVTNTPNVIKHKRAIEKYIECKQPIVIAINTTHALDVSYIDYYAISHNAKFLSEKEQYSKVKDKMFLPLNRFDAEETLTIPSEQIIDFGMKIETGQLKAHNNHCVVPFDNTAAYAICLCIAGKAEKITLVGFDGYSTGDTRQAEMNSLFSQVNEHYNGLNIQALTPTPYPVKKGSIYAPFI
ncbi:aldolase catalytic domain-containing protein [Vibrio coralliilyticus]|uniref:aldolase catalytic domain-containing protein n=1 Tax=Vibrio coralliilyticus TaxID=190893 RepID=UPI00391725DE